MEFSEALETEPQALAHALRQRDPEAIGRLVAQYHYRLLRYLVFLTSRREQAEDLVQETWLRVLERAGQYDGRSRFEPWLFSIARHLAIDDLRRRQRIEPASTELPSGSASPFHTAARSEDASRIAGALGELEPIYRESLLLRFQEGLTLAEIASVTDSPVTTIASRIHRGLKMLRTALEGAANDV